MLVAGVWKLYSPKIHFLSSNPNSKKSFPICRWVKEPIIPMPPPFVFSPVTMNVSKMVAWGSQAVNKVGPIRRHSKGIISGSRYWRVALGGGGASSPQLFLLRLCVLSCVWGQRRATLSDVACHIRHVGQHNTFSSQFCQLQYMGKDHQSINLGREMSLVNPFFKNGPKSCSFFTVCNDPLATQLLCARYLYNRIFTTTLCMQN